MGKNLLKDHNNLFLTPSQHFLNKVVPTTFWWPSTGTGKLTPDFMYPPLGPKKKPYLLGGPEFQKSGVGVWGEFFGGKFGFSGLQKKVSAGSKKSKIQKPSYNPQKSKILKIFDF